ncbi:hypothetical protein Tco_0337270 [Tanacetum coccineum]
MALPPRDQRHQYLRCEGLQYTNADIADFETRLARIYRREVHRVQVFDFGGLPDWIAEGLSTRMLMEHRDAQGQIVFTSRAWRRLFDITCLLVHELILEFFSTFRFKKAVTDLDTGGALQFQLGGLMEASGQTYQAFDGTFWGSSPAAFQRRTRQRTGEASTSIAQQDQQQPDL